MENNLNTQGFVLLDVDVVALNNAGKDTTSNFDNAVKTKSIYKEGRQYVYVSGQAWRYWWRNTLQKTRHWNLSPVIRDKSIAFTAANPIEYADDDLFGYMRAASESYIDEKNKQKSRNITVTRISPLKNSALISVASVHPASNWSSMSRQDGDAVPYVRQEYSAVMKGMFSISLNSVGTFSDYNRTGFKNLSEDLKQSAIENGAIEIDDPFGTGKLIRLPLNLRIQRIVDVIHTLKNISGGAMQTNNLGDVTPKLIVLATTKTGNHPFSHIVKSSGDRDERAVLNIDGIKQVISDYKQDFFGKVFIGRRSGFFDEYDTELNSLKATYPELIDYVSINEAIDMYTEQLKEQIDE